MKYAGMPSGMWLIYKKSFRDSLVSVLGLSDMEADEIMRSAKLRYREIIGNLPEFEKEDRFKTNIVNCALLSAVILSMKKKQTVEALTDYYEQAMTTPATKWFCRQAGRKKFSDADINEMKKTAALKAADRNPYSWNMEYLDYGDGSGYEARFTKCGICMLMKELGIYEYVPAMCHLDYTMSAMGGATKFVRQNTLAAGGPYCDCGYKKKKIKQPRRRPFTADKIQNAYQASKNIYDDVLTQGSILSKLYIKIFWSGTDDNEIARKTLSYIPDDFKGTILDVPAGTAVFTEKKWKALSEARISCLDYSVDMINQARKRLEGCSHISCIQGDVGNLPMDDGYFDIVLSMNGFHAFPDKKKAFKETHRVLKSGGKFISCFYIKGKSGITDWLVKTILAKKGWFTPPFPTEEQLKRILRRLYKDIDIHVDGSMVYFCCTK